MKKKLIFVYLLLICISIQGQIIRAPINIANQYCKFLGYELKRDPITKETICVLPNGQEVSPWTFFRGEVAPEYSYCVKKGRKIRTKKYSKNGKVEYTYPICYTNGKPQHLLKFMEENGDYYDLFPYTIGAPEPPDTLPPEDPGDPEDPEPPIANFPLTFDWNYYPGGKDLDGVVEDQGLDNPYGICYAIVAASVAESAYAIGNNYNVDSLKDFSEAFIAYFGANHYNNMIPPWYWFYIRRLPCMI